MQDDTHPTDDAATAPDRDVAVRLAATTTLIEDNDESDTLAQQDDDAAAAGGATVSTVAAAPAPTPPKPTPPLRVVLALRPRPSEGGAAPTYDVTISADRGKDAACDPYWRSFDDLNLHGALDEAADVVAAAEEKWRSDPTYPRVAPQQGKAATKPATGGKGKPAPAKRPPAAPTALLPTATPANPTPLGPAPRPEPPAPATSPAPCVVQTLAQDAEPTESGQLVTPSVGGPPLPLGKPPAGAKKAGDRKQLSLFG